jgi:2-desacetyl-2-hydroxyethyl bacteriochlorophyllide A dehydrogenase
MANNHASAFWVVATARGELRSEPIPQPREEEVLVHTLYSGISRGTEALVFRGEVPPSEYQRMRAPFQRGEFPAPVKYGYLSVGEVEAGPSALIGRSVFCLHPHQTRYVVPASAVYPLPQSVPAERAVLAGNLETAINALWDAAPRVGERIAVVGGGVVGCLVAWLAGRIPGCRVELIDTNPARARVAQALGVRFGSPDAAEREADRVIHASGTGEGLTSALRLAAFEATVLELSWYGERTVTLPLGEAFHSRRLTLRSSQVGSIAADQRARWTAGRRMELALRLLAEPVLDVLISGESPFGELPQLMARLAESPGDELCHRISYR